MATRPLRSRPAEWLRRYGPPELLCLGVTLGSSWLALAATGNLLLAALVGTWAEFVAYYGTILCRELVAAGRPSPRAALGTARAMLLEFGPAELLDSMLVRPAALAAGMALLPSAALGALAGKLVADLVFYVPTIASYELLRRRRAAG